MNVAVIGAGHNATGHAQALATIENVQVVGIADPVIERAETLAAEVNAKPYTDHRTMLDSARPDAVWVSSPCWLHPDHTVDCAEAGAHVMCEKPMALTLADCDRMIDAAQSHGVKLMIGQSTRYSATLLELKRILESGRCGDLVNSWSLRLSYHQVQPQSLWRLEGDKSGGIVFEWEVHEIDFVCSLGGKVKEVYAKTANSREEAPSFLDHFSAILTFEGGRFGNLEASQTCPVGLSGRGFVGTKGAAQTQGRDTIRIRTSDMEKVESVQIAQEQGPGRLTQDGDFIRAIREGEDSPIPGEDGRANIEIGLAIIESGKTGAVVKLPLKD